MGSGWCWPLAPFFVPSYRPLGRSPHQGETPVPPPPLPQGAPHPNPELPEPLILIILEGTRLAIKINKFVLRSQWLFPTEGSNSLF